MIKVHVQTQNFYDRQTGDKHEVSIFFVYDNVVSRKSHDVTVDGKKYASAEFKGQAFDEVVNILKETGWSPVNPF